MEKIDLNIRDLQKNTRRDVFAVKIYLIQKNIQV
jgi:hypothetical protein